MTEEIKANRRRSEENRRNGKHDVLFSSNPEDEWQVKTIENLLMDNGLAPWREVSELRPGLPRVPSLEKEIEQTGVAAIFIGKAGLDPWQKLGRMALLNELAERDCPLIPVILEGAPENLKLPSFLRIMPPVDFRKKDPDPLEQLIFGITGKHPEKVYRPGVLIASLGDSPAVIPAMYDLLTQRERLTLDRVVVLHPKGEDIRCAFKLVRETLRGTVPVESEMFDFDDANSWQTSCVFLQRLCKLLNHYQRQSDSVYLSLAGGRKSMAALMAWVVPFFSCVKGLYHVVDPADDHFHLHSDIQGMTDERAAEVMHPDLKRLLLVDIPCERKEPINPKLLEKLLESLPEDFDRAEAIITGRTIFQENPPPEVWVTELADQQFLELSQQNLQIAQQVHRDLLAMHQMTVLEKDDTRIETRRYKQIKPYVLRSFIDVPSSLVSPVFYTSPASPGPDNPIKQIVICSLENVGQNGYRTLKKMEFSPEFFSIIQGELPPVPSPEDSVLIVPLGESPMVATQLYTLLKERQRRIHEIVLVYPESDDICNAARVVRDALREEGDNVLCTLAYVSGLKDITCADHCLRYQRCLEDEITRVQETYQGCKIDLALSGGRKGMTAMTIFAAQKKDISYVYHTLVTDEALGRIIEAETTVNALSDVSPQERNDRLFLRAPAYRKEGRYPYGKFVLFPVPIFSSADW